MAQPMAPSPVSTIARSVAILALMMSAGCGDQSHNYTNDSVGQEADRIITEAGQLLESIKPHSDTVTEHATQELSKLNKFEYQILEAPPLSSTAEISKLLSDAGQKGWDCFAVESNDLGTRIFCKRRPESYLRYIPRWFPG